jgi:N-acetylmuramoyl-L-alanine amidase
MVTTLLAQPVYADKDSKGGGGGGGRSGGAHVSAPAHVSVAHAPAFHANVMHAPSAPHMAFSRPAPTVHAPSMPHMAFDRPAPTVHAPSMPHTTFSRSAPIVRSTPSTTFTPSVTQGRTFVQPQRNAPSIAFGGRANNNAVNAQNARNFAATDPAMQSTVRGDPRSFRPPTEMSRGWDRGRTHEWRHHHFRFFGGDWVIIDPGIPYDYGYPYGSYYGDEPAPYSSPAYSYDYSSSDSLVANVQDQLTRLGYSPGPVDGVLGPQTRDAIADFQNDRGLPPTGQIDRSLLRTLGL